MARFWLISAAVFGFLSVALGAFGAHGLKDVLSEYGHIVYDKAVRYQMFHTLALFALGVLQIQLKEISFKICGWSFIIGIILFSGSLYLLALTDIKWLGALTPFGGVAFTVGWFWLGYTIVKNVKK